MTVAASEASAAPMRRAQRRATWWAFFFVFGAIVVLWSLSIPMMGGPDEPAHAVKAVAVARGEFRTGFVRARGGGFLAPSIPATRVRVPEAYGALRDLPLCWLTQSAVPASCAHPVGNDESVVTATTYVGTYPPLYYLLVGWPSRVLKPSTALYAMRILTGLICAALLASGLTIAARLGRMLLVGAAISVTPMVLFLAGSINPNAVEIAAAFCVWLSLLELLTGSSPPVSGRMLVRITVASVLLVGTRPLSPGFLVAIVVVVFVLVGDRATLRRLWVDARVRLAAVVVSAFTALSVLYVLVNRSLGAFIEYGVGQPQSSRLDIARTAMHLTGQRIEQAIGILEWIGPGQVRLPHLLITGWIAATLLVASVALVVGGLRERAVLLALLAGCLALPIVAQAGNAHGADWQGRYGLPVLVGVPLLSGWVIDRSRRLSRIAEQTLGTTVVAAIAISYVVAYQRVMTRNVVGLPNSLFAGLSRGVWHGPASPASLFAWCLTSSLGYAALTIWLLWDPNDSLERGPTRKDRLKFRGRRDREPPDESKPTKFLPIAN